MKILEAVSKVIILTAEIRRGKPQRTAETSVNIYLSGSLRLLSILCGQIFILTDINQMTLS